MAYEEDFDIIDAVETERRILEQIICKEVKVVSMHRPSKKTLIMDYKFENLINCYSEEFFNKFKYLSDSRRQWRENVSEIIQSQKYDKLHILTHAFWYNEQEIDLKDSLKKYIMKGNQNRFLAVDENLMDLIKILTFDEV